MTTITTTKSIKNITYSVRANVGIVGKGDVIGDVQITEYAPKERNRYIFTAPFSFKREKVQVMSPAGNIQGNGYIVKNLRISLASDGFTSKEMAMHYLRGKGLPDEILDELLEGVHRECLSLSKEWSLNHLSEFTNRDLERVASLAKAIRGSWSESVFAHDPENGHMKTAWRMCWKTVALYEEVEGRHYHGRIPPETYLGDEATQALLEFHFHMEDNRVSEDGRSYTRAYHRTMKALASS